MKSVGSIFAKAIQIGFEPQLHRNMEAYMGDIVVKTKDKATLVHDLEETFANLRKMNLKLNPEKCVFGIPSGKLLGFFVSQRFPFLCNKTKTARTAGRRSSPSPPQRHDQRLCRGRILLLG